MGMRYGIRRPGHLTGAGAGVLAVATAVAGLAGAPSAAAATATHLVAPGQSIQAAVNAARPGDTVLIEPGTYRGSVLVTVPRLTIRGTSARQVTLEPAAAPAEGATKSRPAAGATTATACFAAGAGICVAGTAGHRLTGVSVRDLTVTGFATYGLAATETDGLAVTGVAAERNGTYGIGVQKSVRSRVIGNAARDNGEAGILLANTVSEEGGALDTGGADIAGNALTGNKMGVVLRRVRDMTLQANAMTGNCAGIFVVGDENVPRGGHLTVRGNSVSANTKFCAATSRLPAVQGSGIVLTGVEDTLVAGNTVTGNTGKEPMSGGIVLARSFVGVPDSGNTIRDNLLHGNAPADLLDQAAAAAGSTTGTGTTTTGTGTTPTGGSGTPGAAPNTFTGNACAVSLPAGHC